MRFFVQCSLIFSQLLSVAGSNCLSGQTSPSETNRVVGASVSHAVEVSCEPPVSNLAAATDLKVMTWNIWHGGREDGESAGPQRVIDVIRDSGADVIALQETYGSGELLAKGLGFHFHPRGTNVSILSRHPVIEDISVFKDFKCVGALIELPDKQRVAFYSIWLPYDAEIWEKGTRNNSDPQSLLDACKSSAVDLEKIRTEIDDLLDDPKYHSVPIIIAGDFNSMSHLDYTEANRDQFGAVVEWPTSQVLTKTGYSDTYRQLHPEVNRLNDRTWTPRFPEQEQDRIDFIYVRGDTCQPVESVVIEHHAGKFPSDHAALLTTFRFNSNDTDRDDPNKCDNSRDTSRGEE